MVQQMVDHGTSAHNICTYQFINSGYKMPNGVLKMQRKIYYSVQNCGDGSAYPRLFESMELAELDQDMMDEGWGESCTGSITVESESPIAIVDEVTTIDDMIKDCKDGYFSSEKERKQKLKILSEFKKKHG